MSGNDFFEEKGIQMRRGGAPPAAKTSQLQNLPKELKPKFPKNDASVPLVPEEPPLQTPITPESPMVQKSVHEGNNNNNDNNGGENGPVDHELPQPLEDSGDNRSQNQPPEPKKKKKPKKPTKPKDTGGAMAVFVDDSKHAMAEFVDDDSDENAKKDKEKKKKKPEKAAEKMAGNKKIPKTEEDNAVGLFVEEDDEEKKKKEKIEKLEKTKEKASLREKQKEKMKKKEKEKEKEGKEIKQPKTDKDNNNKDIGKEKGSVRQKSKRAKTASGRQRKAPAQPPAQPAPKQQSVRRTTTAAKPTVTNIQKEKEEGFLKNMYFKARQKIVQMSKNPAISSSSSGSEDTFVVTDATVLKPEVTAVYGGPSDYPKGQIPPKSDKSHPDKLFPGGRPFWMNRDEKPPQAKVIMMSMVNACVKDGTLKLVEQQAKPEFLNPYAEDVSAFKAKDEEFFTDYRRILANTVYDSCSMKAVALGTIKLDKTLKSMRTSTKKLGKIAPPAQTTTYLRREHKKKQQLTKNTFQPGIKLKAQKKKRKSSNAKDEE